MNVQTDVRYGEAGAQTNPQPQRVELSVQTQTFAELEIQTEACLKSEFGAQTDPTGCDFEAQAHPVPTPTCSFELQTDPVFFSTEAQTAWKPERAEIDI